MEVLRNIESSERGKVKDRGDGLTLTETRTVKKIAIVGLPNTGKSQIFNNLTREYALVANYPFTTVETKSLRSKKERYISIYLIAFAIPCADGAQYEHTGQDGYRCLCNSLFGAGIC
ncbi:MAG: GTPase domain-containing protein [Candidatus Omnitrophota bacterium]